MLLRPPPRTRRPAPRLVLPRIARGRASVEVAEAPPSGVQSAWAPSNAARGAGEGDFDSAFEAAFERAFTSEQEPAAGPALRERCFFCGVPFNEGDVACWLEYYESRAHEACEIEARSGRVRYKGC